MRYHTIRYDTLRYDTILYDTIRYYTISYYTILSCPILRYAMLSYPILYYTILYYAMLCYAMLCYAMLCYAMLCYSMLYYTMLYYTRLYYTILITLHCTILYCVVFKSGWQQQLNVAHFLQVHEGQHRDLHWRFLSGKDATAVRAAQRREIQTAAAAAGIAHSITCLFASQPVKMRLIGRQSANTYFGSEVLAFKTECLVLVLATWAPAKSVSTQTNCPTNRVHGVVQNCLSDSTRNHIAATPAQRCGNEYTVDPLLGIWDRHLGDH